MRELKFRVWDKLAKRFIYPDKGYQGHYILTLKGKFHNLQNGSGGDDYEVQQYTGLNDMKGKEIYDGDIIRGYYETVKGTITNKVKVEYHEVFGYQWRNWDIFSIEILGNAFENPELL